VIEGSSWLQNTGWLAPFCYNQFLLRVPRIILQSKIVLLPGDGIGPEVVGQAVRVLEAVARQFKHSFSFSEHMIGGVAIDSTGDALPQSTTDACKLADAILLGAVGGPKWDDPNAKTRPEAGLLKIRKELGLFANLRPIVTFEELLDSSPLKRHIIEGTDILFFRELTGGLYFGPSGLEELPDGQQRAYSTAVYTTHEVERIVRMAAHSAIQRRGKLTMVDKANVLEASRLWRRVSAKIMKEEFPSLEYEVVLVDSMAMHLLSRPTSFDVVVTSNMFGDILTDEASMLPGSLGMLPSASLGSSGPGLYEPIHGSAPDIAGKGIANPLATILASAMLLRHSLSLETEAQAIERAVKQVLADGHRTADLVARGQPSLGTIAITDLVLKALAA
jgi:3-isopropylmalate dehydrogenase